jgi:hypothetical protein
MTKKAEFNADEWSTLVEAPVLAGMRVIAADRGGTIRESLAMGRVYTEARQQQGDSELLDELVKSPPAADPERIRSAGDLGAAAGERLREAVRIAEEKASPEEAEAYRQFILAVAQAAANAHKEGGFLGVGGEQVGEGERAALDEIAGALGVGDGPR